MKHPKALLRTREGRDFLILTALLLLVFLVGGGARGDIQSLVLLRPISTLALAYALVGFRWPETGLGRSALVLALAWTALSLLHVMPLPPALWHGLSGRELLVQADRLAGLDGIWRPLAIAPNPAWNALYALLVPLAVLLLGLRCRPEDLRLLLPVFIVFALVSGIVGLLQVSSGRDSALYFYRIHSEGMAAGLFANRNHAAFLLACAFPMLATFAATAKTESQAQFRRWGGIIAAILLVPLVLAIGSRAGLVFAAAGIASAFALYRRPRDLFERRHGSRRISQYALLGSLAFALVALTALLSKAVAIDRLLSGEAADDLRFAVWHVSLPLVGHYFPFGSGIGTFVEAYQIVEPVEMIGPAYVNHAHNDYLELLMTTGLPGAAIALVALLLLVRHAISAWRGSAQSDGSKFARLGAVVIGILLLASIADYPLRVPSLSALFVVAVLWLRGGSSMVRTSARV